jgi:hypothetical protein
MEKIRAPKSTRVTSNPVGEAKFVAKNIVSSDGDADQVVYVRVEPDKNTVRIMKSTFALVSDYLLKRVEQPSRRAGIRVWTRDGNERRISGAYKTLIAGENVTRQVVYDYDQQGFYFLARPKAIVQENVRNEPQLDQSLQEELERANKALTEFRAGVEKDTASFAASANKALDELKVLLVRTRTHDFDAAQS